MNQAPVVVWQRGAYRIVAVDAASADERPMLVFEQRLHDALNQESWSFVPHEEQFGPAIDALVTEIASKIDMMPKWVRDFVRADIADLESCTCEHNGSSSS